MLFVAVAAGLSCVFNVARFFEVLFRAYNVRIIDMAPIVSSLWNEEKDQDELQGGKGQQYMKVMNMTAETRAPLSWTKNRSPMEARVRDS